MLANQKPDSPTSKKKIEVHTADVARQNLWFPPPHANAEAAFRKYFTLKGVFQKLNLQ